MIKSFAIIGDLLSADNTANQFRPISLEKNLGLIWIQSDLKYLGALLFSACLSVVTLTSSFFIGFFSKFHIWIVSINFSDKFEYWFCRKNKMADKLATICRFVFVDALT